MKLDLSRAAWYPEERALFSHKAGTRLRNSHFTSVRVSHRGTALVSELATDGFVVGHTLGGAHGSRVEVLTPCCLMSFPKVQAAGRSCLECSAFFPPVTSGMFFGPLDREDLLELVPFWLDQWGAWNPLEAELVYEPMVDGLLSYHGIMRQLFPR